MDEAEEELDMAPDPFLEAGIEIPPPPVHQTEACSSSRMGSVRGSMLSILQPQQTPAMNKRPLPKGIIHGSMQSIQRHLLRRGFSRDPTGYQRQDTTGTQGTTVGNQELMEVLIAEQEATPSKSNSNKAKADDGDEIIQKNHTAGLVAYLTIKVQFIGKIY